MTNKSDSTRTIFDFADQGQVDQWVAVNDNVMGGLSDGVASACKDSCLLFSGSISLENNGGFSSIRTLSADFGLAGYTGIAIRVKGDGRSYQFRLRRDRNIDGVAFKQEFSTIADTWVEIKLPFDAFLPTYRGRVLEEVEALDAVQIQQLGFLIADKAAGPFTLIVDSINAYR